MHRVQSLYHPPPAAESDTALIQRYKVIIDRCARKIAARVGDPQLADELWTAGALGLIDAARRYDGDRKVKFETFAEHRIRGAMLDEMRKADHLPRRLRAQADQIIKAKAKLAHTLGREAESHELAEALGMTQEEAQEIEQVSLPPLPFSSELPSMSYEAELEEGLQRKEVSAHMALAVGALPERLQILLSLHYAEELTYKEIAGVLKISEPRVCQLHAEALNKLKTALSESASNSK